MYTPHRWLSSTASATLFLWLAYSAPPACAQVVISQAYGGGGNTGAYYRNDFVELFNRGTTAVDVSGWTVQYASATGSSWDRTLLNGVIQPGQFYLIQEGQGNSGTSSLPTPDASGGVNLSATAGKVALVRSSSLLSGTAPSGSQIVDFLGYGNANHARGNPAGTLTNTTAAIRKANGCMDTGNNSADFAIGSPSPRNRQSPANPCSSLPPPTAPGPEVMEAGVVNAASYTGGAVAAGEIITVFGTRMGPDTLVRLELTTDGQWVSKSLSGTRALFDGVPAALIYTSVGQLSAVVPYSVAGRARTEMRVEYNGVQSNAVTLLVAAAAPGLFTTDSSGTGQAAALNQDHSFNGPGSPAAKGSVITLYATGGGQTAPGGEDGRVVTGDPPRLVQPVRVEIGGVEAQVLYAGAAPYLVSGVIQINALIPESLASGDTVPVRVVVGGFSSRSGVTVSVAGAGAPGGDGSGPSDIDQKLARLQGEKDPPPLPEIPNDRIGIPQDWLAVVSWNIQTGGTSTSVTSARPPLVRSALSSLFSGTYQILSAQEIPDAESASLLTTMLPGGSGTWRAAFQDTTDSMDNGFWYRTGVTVSDSAPLFVTGQRDSSGRWIVDSTRAVHPPHVAQFAVGDFDFTMVNVHLTFEDGNTSESAREMRTVLDYLDWYFDQPDHDPDVMVCGDFNIPSALSGQTGRGGITLDSIINADPRFQSGERRFAVTVHQPTSRSSAASGGAPASNFDHCVVSADMMEEFIQARRVQPEILTDHPEDPEQRLTSDHYPIVMFFRTGGEGVVLDSKTRIR